MEMVFNLVVTPQHQALNGVISDVTVVTCVHTPDKMLTSEIPVTRYSITMSRTGGRESVKVKLKVGFLYSATYMVDQEQRAPVLIMTSSSFSL